MIVLAELEPRALQQQARHQRLRMERGLEVLDSQLLNVSGWLTASLFAINAGGGIAALGASEKLDDSMLPIGLFGIGIVFAMLNAYAIQALITLQNGPIEDLLAILQRAENSATIEAENFDTSRAALSNIQRWGWTAPLFGWVSGILFLVGGAALARDQASISPKEHAICRRLQIRMFRPDETAIRSRELFKVIGCRFE